MKDTGPMFEVMEHAVKQGWKHEVTSSGHHKLIPPNDGNIVITSSSPGDGRVYKNFLAQMKRSGYKEPDEREELMEKRRVRGVKDTVMDVLRSNSPKPYNTDELKAIVKARVPEAGPNAVHTAMKSLYDGGLVVRLSMGQYRWAEEVHPTFKDLLPQEPVMIKSNGAALVLPEGVEPVAAAPAPAPAPQDAVTEVEQLLADFLDIAARIEKVLRKHVRIEQKNEELKALLLSRDD